ncbi:hypothetical protein Tco_0879618 [Tanacetum coccineum]
MASLDHRLNPLFSIKECMTCGALYTVDFCCSKGGLEGKVLVPKPSQNYATCGNPVDGSYCRHCVFMRKCFNEGRYTIHDENEILNTSKSSNHNINIVSTPQEPFVFNQDPGKNSSQSPLQINHNCCYKCGDLLDGIFCQQCTCKSCGNGAHIGYNCPPKVLIISNPEQCNQTINELPQTLPSVHSTCNYEDENSFTYDSKLNTFNDSPSVLTHPPQLQFETYLCELCGNNAHYCYDCPPQFPLGMIIKPPNEKCMALLLAEKRFLKIKQVMREEQNQPENPIPSGSKGISDDICDNSDAESLLSQDIPITSPKIDFLSEEFTGEFTPISPGMDEDEFDEEEVDCYDHDISSDDDSYENIEYVEASSLNLEYDSLEEENEDQEEKEFDLEDIFQIQDVILREKLLNIHRLIANIEYLKNNPTPNFVFKSPSSFPISVVDSDSFFEESDTSLDNSLPVFETFSDHTEEARSGSTTTHANYSLPEYDSFLFDIEPDQEGLISIDNSNDPLLELPEFESFHFDPSFPRPPPDVCLDMLYNDESFEPGEGENIIVSNVEEDDSFTFTIRTFLPFLTYLEVSPLSCSTGSEDLIFDPGIITFYFLKPLAFLWNFLFHLLSPRTN